MIIYKYDNGSISEHLDSDYEGSITQYTAIKMQSDRIYQVEDWVGESEYADNIHELGVRNTFLLTKPVRIK